jgi:hypothetical protein
MTKTTKIWDFRTIETRRIAEYLNGITGQGERVFGVYPSATQAGSLDVLFYHEVRVPIGKPALSADAPKA